MNSGVYFLIFLHSDGCTTGNSCMLSPSLHTSWQKVCIPMPFLLHSADLQAINCCIHILLQLKAARHRVESLSSFLLQLVVGCWVFTGSFPALLVVGSGIVEYWVSSFPALSGLVVGSGMVAYCVSCSSVLLGVESGIRNSSKE